MSKDRAIIDFEIIWKKINHTLTEKEERLLLQWLNESPLHQQYLDKAMHYYQQGSDFTDPVTETKNAWNELNIHSLKNRHHKSGWIIALSAAAAIIFLFITYFLPPKKPEVVLIAKNKGELIMPGTRQAILILDDGSVHDLTSSKKLVLNDGGAEIKSEGTKLEYTEKESNSKEVKYNTLSIPRGGEFFLQLADGTKVWLNSETVLRYPVQFTGNERRVELNGEAFFEVARNEQFPFLVESGEQTVKVLGTQFNISSYHENPIIYTTLVKGSVEVSVKNRPGTKETLVPNEQSSIRKADGDISKRKVDPYPFVAWKDGRFVFQDQNLGEIMNTLSKWYNVEVVFTREELRDIRFTGNLERYSDFGKVLRKIGKTNEVKFTIENKQVTIR